VVRAHRFNW